MTIAAAPHHPNEREKEVWKMMGTKAEHEKTIFRWFICSFPSSVTFMSGIFLASSLNSLLDAGLNVTLNIKIKYMLKMINDFSAIFFLFQIMISVDSWNNEWFHRMKNGIYAFFAVPGEYRKNFESSCKNGKSIRNRKYLKFDSSTTSHFYVIWLMSSNYASDYANRDDD